MSDLDSSLDSSMMASSRASSTSSLDSPTPTATATSKNGGMSASPSWRRWVADKYTVQYAIPAAYAPAALQVCITAFPLGVLFGLVLPRITTLVWQTMSKGTMDGEGLAWYAQPQLALYLGAWVVFHMLEFMVTASFNPTRLFSDSFLLNNGIHYHVAHLVALLEFGLTAHLYPWSKAVGWTTWMGLAGVGVGQVLRSMAMVQAHNNFSHIVAERKRADHVLVTHGVYAWTRHPSYVGFFYWAVGTQLMLGNRIALVGFVGALWTFFSRRVRAEEKWLVEFFGDEYRQYAKRTGTGLPFI